MTEEGVIAGLVPKFTVAPATNPVPVRVNVKAAPPAVAEVGASEVRVGAEAALIVNDRLPDVPPPGAGFVTVTVARSGSGDIGGCDCRSQLRCTDECSGLGGAIELHDRRGDKSGSIYGQSEGGASGGSTGWGEGGYGRRRIIDGEGLSVRGTAARRIRDRYVHSAGRGDISSGNRGDDLSAGDGGRSNRGIGAEIHCSTGDETRACESQCEGCSPCCGGGWRDEVRVGAEAALIVNDRLPDVPPPGAGFVTVTVARSGSGDIGGSDCRGQLRCAYEM